MSLKINEEKLEGLRSIKISVEEDGQSLGRAFLYFINNDLHEKKYGLLEDLWVGESARGKGAGRKLLEAVIEKAKEHDCYKLVAQSRHERCEIHDFYKKFGFKDYGKNFRMDLSE